MNCLRHPNVVLMMGACQTPPKLAILMEFVAGGSLHKVRRVCGRCSSFVSALLVPSSPFLSSLTLLSSFLPSLSIAPLPSHSSSPPPPLPLPLSSPPSPLLFSASRFSMLTKSLYYLLPPSNWVWTYVEGCSTCTPSTLYIETSRARMYSSPLSLPMATQSFVILVWPE